jgi:hypothetical protein
MARPTSTPSSTRAPPAPSDPPPSVDANAAIPLTEDERALLESLDPALFASLPPVAGAWEDEKTPCFLVRSNFSSEKPESSGGNARRCLPNYHVIGAWQSGGQAFNAKLAAHPDVFKGVQPHFWNEPEKPIERYLEGFADFARETETLPPDREPEAEGNVTRSPRGRWIGDASPGVLANTWTESQRLHRSFKDSVATCWRACQALPDEPEVSSSFAAEVPGEFRDNARDTDDANERIQTPRRRCVDGDARGSPKYGDGCIAAAAKEDPLIAQAASLSDSALDSPTSPRRYSSPLSVPHLMRAAYGTQSVKIIALVRVPFARLRAAFYHYPQYQKEFGIGEDGFEAFLEMSVTEFEKCTRAAPGRTRAECAYHFEALGPERERVFYHCDQLIKTMYGTFLKAWMEVFGPENVLALRSEDAFSDDPETRKRALRRALAFLGAREASAEALERMDVTCGSGGDAPGALDERGCGFRDDLAIAKKSDFGDDRPRSETTGASSEKTRALLDAFVAPELSILARLFGDERESEPWAVWGRREV